MKTATDMHVEALELLDVGVGVFDRDLRLRFCNRAFRALRRYPDSICSAGVALADLLRFNAERGDFGDGDVDAQVAERMSEIAISGERKIERLMADGQVLAISYRRMDDTGGLVVTFDDRTAERHAEEALRASEERHSLVTRATSDGIYDWNVVDDVLYVSDHLRELLQLDMDEGSSRMWADVVHPDDYPGYLAALRRHFKGETDAIHCEYRVRARDGGYRSVLDHGVGQRVADGRVTRLVGAIRDVDEVRSIEAESQRATARLLASMSTISDGIMLVGPDNRVELFNDRYVEIFSSAAGGADLSDVVMVGRDFFEMIREGYNLGMFKPHPDGVDAWIAARATAWETETWQWELELANGRWILLNERQMPEGGRISVYTDITEFKRREADAHAARQRFEEAIEAISSGFALWDADDRLVISNSRYREYFAELADIVVPGARFDDIMATGIARGSFPLSEGNVEAYLADIAEKRLNVIGQTREQLINGHWLQITDHRTGDGGVVSIYTDVTQLKDKQTEVERQTEILRLTMENMGQGISLVDRDLNTIALNQKFLELMDFPPAEFKAGFSMEQAFRYNAERGEYGDGDIDQMVRERLDLAAKFLPHRFERTRPDGTVVEIVGNPIEGGGMVATYTDITERKRAEDAVNSALAELQAILENIDYGVLLLDRDLRVKLVNPVLMEQWGFSEEFIAGRPTMREMLEFNRYSGRYDVDQAEWQTWLDSRIDAVRAGDIPPTEMRWRNDGMILRYQCVALPDGGRMVTYLDITELKARERMLDAALGEFNAVLDNIDYGIVFVGADQRTRIANRAFRDMWGMPQEFLDAAPVMRELIEFNRDSGLYDVAPEDWEGWIAGRLEAIAAGDIPPVELARRDGRIIRYQCVALPDGGRMLTYFDITELKKAEQAARDSEARLRNIFENGPIGVAVIDDDDRILFHNPRFAEILGGAGRDLVGTSSEQFRLDRAEGAAWKQRFFAEGKVSEREVKYRRLDGGEVWSLATNERFAWQGAPARLTWIYDITEAKTNREALIEARDRAEAALADLQKAQERLIQSEKMASLGQLTAGIAHEIKNPLNFVNNFAKLSDELLAELSEIIEEPIKALEEEIRDDAEDLLQTVRENLAKINEHGRRADSIVKNMLLHSRDGPSERQKVAVNPLAEEALNLAYHGARAEDPSFNVEMVRDIHPDVGEIECYPQELMRVFLNLVTNGMYAATKRKSQAGDGFAPRIALATRKVDGHVEIEVRDNGVGIPPEVREKIFLPYFTTKPAGEGTGLGLSLSYDIVVKQHGGSLTVESEPGDHTSFTVTLPVD